MRRVILALGLLSSFGACAAVDEGGAEDASAAGARLYRIILPVTNLDEAARFYAAVFEDEGVRISAGRHYFDCGGTILACYDAGADGDGFSPAPLSEWIYFSVDDLEATFARCRAAGATPESGEVDGTPAGEIAVRPWQERSFYVRDPFANGLCFVERGTEFTGRF